MIKKLSPLITTKHFFDNFIPLKGIEEEENVSLINKKLDPNYSMVDKANIKLLANKMKISRENKNIDEELQKNKLKYKISDNVKSCHIAEIYHMLLI